MIRYANPQAPDAPGIVERPAATIQFNDLAPGAKVPMVSVIFL